jgi:hypothetical protein
MFDFYQDDNDESYKLIVPAGAPVPANAAGRKWSFKHQVADPGNHQRKRVNEQGYFMCKMHPGGAGWDELSAVARSQ